VEFVQAAQSAGLKPIIGAELSAGSHPLLLYATNTTGYLNLCRLLSRHAEGAEEDEVSVAAKQRQPLKRQLLADLSEGLLAVSSDASLAGFFPGRFYQMACKRLVSLSSGEAGGEGRGEEERFSPSLRSFLAESPLGPATAHWDHEPARIPLNRPSGTFSPIGGEGWDEGVRFMESILWLFVHSSEPAGRSQGAELEF